MGQIKNIQRDVNSERRVEPHYTPDIRRCPNGIHRRPSKRVKALVRVQGNFENGSQGGIDLDDDGNGKN